jgi:hypothetical protein
MDEAIADIIRKSMRDEASGIDGLGTQVPSPSSVQRWPLGRGTDKEVSE